MTEKTKGILAYIFGWIGGLIFLFSKDSGRNLKIHSAQSIVISIAYFVITIAYAFIPVSIPFFSTILNGVYVVAIIYGIVKLTKEEQPEIPVIGDIANKIFGKQIDGE